MRYAMLLLVLLVGGAWACFSQSEAIAAERMRLDALDTERGFTSWCYWQTPEEEALDRTGVMLALLAVATASASVAWALQGPGAWAPYDDFDGFVMLHLATRMSATPV
jgi:hypothetical protein